MMLKHKNSSEIEEQLSLSEEKHRMLFEKANDAIFIIKDNKIIDCNQKSLEMFGCKQKEIKGKLIYSLLPEKQPNGADSILGFYDLTSLTLKGKSQFLYWKFLRLNGEQFDSEISLNAFEINGEKMMQAIVRDITQRKEAEDFKNKSIKSYFEIFNTSSDIILILSEANVIIDVNKSAIDKFALSKEDIIGNTLEILTKNNNLLIKHLEKSWKQGTTRFDWTGINKKGEEFPVEMIFRKGSYFGKNVLIITGRDLSERLQLEEERLRAEVAEATTTVLEKEITERKETEVKLKETVAEGDILLKEVHHRVKNNLQVISSILNLQSSYVKDEYTLNMLKECRDRIKSMSFIHESLYQSKNFSHVDFGDYLKSLCSNLLHSYAVTDRVSLNFDIDKLLLSLDTSIPCGLIVNELVANALKYAYPNSKKGNIFISLKRKEGGPNLLIIKDDGIGMPKNLNIKETESLGLQLVMTLVDQIDGKLTCESKNGTRFLIEFKAN